MLPARKVQDIPEETVRVAKASFPKGNRYIMFRDEMGVIYHDAAFADLFVWRGQPAESPGFLAMVTILQFAEGLSDRQAAEAVGSRIDWKYVLGLELTAPAIAHASLSKFRQRLIEGGQEQLLLDAMLNHLKERGWLKGVRRQRTDSTHVLAAIRDMNRLEFLGETLRAALNELASVAPDWLLEQVSADWFGVYGPRFENYRLPQERAERETFQVRIGQDGYHLLDAVYSQTAPGWLRELPSLQVLRQVWIQQYYREGDTVHIRTQKKFGLPPNRLMIQSPYDPEARNRTKRDTNWTGYTLHLTETCEAQHPNLITDCQTTPATVGDGQLTRAIHQALDHKGLLPDEHLVDTSYVDAELLLSSRGTYAVDLIGPVPPNPSWQLKDEQAYDLSWFAIDWDNQRVTCPQGKHSTRWQLRQTPEGTPMIDVKFRHADCSACPARARCTRSQGGRPRGLNFRPKEQYQMLQAARQRQETDAFKALYKKRAGIEGTISQAVQAFGLRRTRYVGLAKTHLQHLATAAAMNLTRLAAWLDRAPKAHTRQSRFLALQPSFVT
jgi:transposase